MFLQASKFTGVLVNNLARLDITYTPCTLYDRGWDDDDHHTDGSRSHIRGLLKSDPNKLYYSSNFFHFLNLVIRSCHVFSRGQ